AQIPFLKRALQSGDELATEHSTKDFHGKKEGIPRVNPAFVVRGQATGRHYTMDMRMVQQVLPPGVEHAEEADLRAKVLGISRDLQQAGGAGAEQQVIEKLLVV